jgi:hypothetical protein
MESSQPRALFLLYLAVAPGHYQSVDGMLMFEQARALLYEGSLLFREPFFWDDTFATSLYGIGLSVAYMPALAVFSVFEPDVLQRLGTGVDLRRIYDDPVFTLAATSTQAALAAFVAHRTAMCSLTRIRSQDGFVGARVLRHRLASICLCWRRLRSAFDCSVCGLFD